MFDLVAGGPRHPFHDRTIVPTVLSVVGHVAIISLVAATPLMYITDSVPTVPTVMAFVADQAVVPPPPPPPPPPAPAAVKVPPTKPQSAPNSGQSAAPIEAPAEIRPEAPGVVDVAGVEGGVEGGVVGGVVGGIVGGLVAVAPPPPPPPPLPPRAPSTHVRIGGNIQAPTLIHRVEPSYPHIAVVAKVRGLVILEATVGADGAVDSVRVLRGVKFLDQAAVDAVRQWRYSPLVLNGVPTAFVLSVTLSFSAKEESGN